MDPTPFTIAGRTFTSRLIVGTGKYPDFEVMRRALEASGAAMVTVAVRRVDLTRRDGASLLDMLDLKTMTLLPNTAGCRTAEEAVRTARLGREAGLSDLPDFHEAQIISRRCGPAVFDDNIVGCAAAAICTARH